MTGTSLFALVGEYRAAAERLAELELDEQTVADTLDSLTGDIETKATAVAHVLMNFIVAAENIKDHAAEQMKRAKVLEARAASLRAYIARSMEAAGISKIEGPSARISFRASSAVVIDGVDLVPAEYMRTPEPPPPAPDKVKIAAALKAGETIAGAHLEQRRNLVIAP